MGPAVSQCLHRSSIHPVAGTTNILRAMTCESCRVRFSFLKKKNRCRECQRDFCSGCLMRYSGPRNICQSCHTLTTVPLDRAELMKLRVRDLRNYLNLHQVPSNTCTEKTELVDLVMIGSGQTYSYNPQPTSPTTPRAPSPVVSPRVSPRVPSPRVSPRVSSPRETPTVQPENIATRAEERTPPKKEEPLVNLSSSAAGDILDVNPEDLTPRQLKEILAKNFITYAGCFEKRELVEKVKRLQKQVQENNLRVLQGMPEESLCKICMDAPVDCVLLECGHMLACTTCGRRLHECPVCRQYVVRVVHTFNV